MLYFVILTLMPFNQILFRRWKLQQMQVTAKRKGSTHMHIRLFYSYIFHWSLLLLFFFWCNLSVWWKLKLVVSDTSCSETCLTICNPNKHLHNIICIKGHLIFIDIPILPELKSKNWKMWETGHLIWTPLYTPSIEVTELEEKLLNFLELYVWMSRLGHREKKRESIILL